METGFEERVRSSLRKWHITFLRYDVISFNASVNVLNRCNVPTEISMEEEIVELTFKCLNLSASYWNKFQSVRLLQYKVDFLNIQGEAIEQIRIKVDLLKDTDKHFVVEAHVYNDHSSLLAKSSAILSI
jgi:hypothetical protein